MLKRNVIVGSTLLLVILISGVWLLVFPSNSAVEEAYVSRTLPTSEVQAQELKVMWTGTAGIYLSDGQTGILIDPFVSKFSMAHVLLEKPIASLPDKRKVLYESLEGLPVDVVLVSHSHYDHSIDAPHIAEHYKVPLIGSKSTDAINKSFGYMNAVVAEHGSIHRIGEFTITMRFSTHGNPVLDYYGFPGEIELGAPLEKASDYKLGKVYAIHIEHKGFNMVHHASAGFLPDTYEGMRADLAFLGLALRESSESLMDRVVGDLGVKTIVPIHFDNFFVEAPKELPLVFVSEFVKTVEKSYPGVGLKFTPPFNLYSLKGVTNRKTNP